MRQNVPAEVSPETRAGGMPGFRPRPSVPLLDSKFIDHGGDDPCRTLLNDWLESARQRGSWVGLALVELAGARELERREGPERVSKAVLVLSVRLAHRLRDRGARVFRTDDGRRIVVVIIGEDSSDARWIRRRVREATEDPVAFADGSVRLQIEAAVASFPDDAGDSEGLIARARSQSIRP
jgi:predicted signal transduction protein with EAL and GGDEF domain